MSSYKKHAGTEVPCGTIFFAHGRWSGVEFCKVVRTTPRFIYLKYIDSEMVGERPCEYDDDRIFVDYAPVPDRELGSAVIKREPKQAYIGCFTDKERLVWVFHIDDLPFIEYEGEPIACKRWAKY